MKEQREQLEAEMKEMDGTHPCKKSKVKLDIGGTRFTTSKSTLMNAPDSFLSAMLRCVRAFFVPREYSNTSDRMGYGRCGSLVVCVCVCVHMCTCLSVRVRV